MLISFCIGQPLYRKDKGPAPNVSACMVLLYFEMMFSRVHDSRLLLNTHNYIHETRGHKFHYGQIKRSRHGPRCGHTPIDIVS